VLAGVRDAADASRLASRLLDQRLRPHEVQLWLEGDMARWPTPPARPPRPRARRSAGRWRRWSPGHHHGGVTGAGLAAAARAAVSPWSAEWDPQAAYPSSYLLELMCALECSRADAVGPPPGRITCSPTCWNPAVARTDLLREGAPPGPPGPAAGLRLFAVTLTAAPAAVRRPYRGPYRGRTAARAAGSPARVT